MLSIIMLYNVGYCAISFATVHAAINGDGVLAIQHATAHPSSSSSAYSQVPLSVVETAAGGTGNIEAAMPSQDVPVDFSVPSRSVSLQSTDASLYDSNDVQPKGPTAFYNSSSAEYQRYCLLFLPDGV